MNIEFKKDLEILHELTDAVDKAREALWKHKGIMVKYCKVKVGDEVVCNGYTHSGKTISVDHVWIKDMYGGKYQFWARGKVKKKDGTLGVQVGTWHDKEYLCTKVNP